MKATQLKSLKLGLVFPLLLIIALVGCSTKSTGVIPDGKDAYRITHTGGEFTNSNTLQRETYSEASTFCAGKGKVAETIEMDSKRTAPMGGWPEVSLLFRCVDREVD